MLTQRLQSWTPQGPWTALFLYSPVLQGTFILLSRSSKITFISFSTELHLINIPVVVQLCLRICECKVKLRTNNKTKLLQPC